MIPTWKQYIQNNENGLATFTDDEIEAERQKREQGSNLFPLDVFNPKIAPFINALAQNYDIHRAYIGLCLLSAYSTAIGTAYTVATNETDRIYLPIWGCLLGLSSSGKTLAINKIYGPLNKIQDQFNRQWDEETHGLSDDGIKKAHMHQLIYRDIFTPTLVRYVIPDNPKGLCKMADELLEWINGMNPGSKTGRDGIDEQFWLSVWNCTQYDAVRSGKQKFVCKRPFINIIGGTQYKVLPDFFAKNRDTSGFIFRLLFAIDDRSKMAEVDPYFQMPKEWAAPHEHSLEFMYRELAMPDSEEEPGRCILTHDAINLYHSWVRTSVKAINEMEDIDDRELQAGIFGKTKEYCLRFAALLHISDKVLNADMPENIYKARLSKIEYIDVMTLHRAMKLAQYFHKSSEIAYERVKKQRYAPHDAIVCANLMRKIDKRFSLMQIAGVIYGNETEANKSKLKRNLKKWMFEYSWLFNTRER
jgi:hypothetical protein